MARLTSFLRGERGSLSPFILIMMISLVIVASRVQNPALLFLQCHLPHQLIELPRK